MKVIIVKKNLTRNKYLLMKNKKINYKLFNNHYSNLAYKK